MNSSAEHEARPAPLEPEGAVAIAVHTAAEKKGADIVVLDLRQVATFTDYFVIATARGARQTKAIAEGIEDALRKAGKRPLHAEGYSSGEWILLDYGDFIVHIFTDTSRRFYDLERLWRDAGRMEFKEQEA
jgi:ribosome-associated protein